LDSSEAAALEPPDRRTGLVLFGILDVLIALQYLVKVIAIALIAFAGAKPNVGGVDVARNLPLAALLALIPMAFFLSIGIGSAIGRRWARSLSLAFSWIWLGFGSVTAVALLLCLPKLAASGGDKPPLLVYGLITLFGLVLPGAYLLFYRSQAVKAYCEWLDSEERWTDRCPVSILAVMMLLALGANLALTLGFSSPRQALFLGHSLAWNARLWFAAAAVFELAVAWRLYLREFWAWIASIAVMVVRGAVSVAIALNLTVERLTEIATKAAAGRLKPKDAAALEALKTLHLTAAMTTYVAVLALLELGFVIWAGKWVRENGSTQARAPEGGVQS
jgi:hypothetical protein